MNNCSSHILKYSNLTYIQCVYGDEHIEIINNILIPSIIASTTRPVVFSCTNYNCNSTSLVTSRQFDNVSVENYVFKKGRIRGFAESHNDLFNQVKPVNYFIIINPDCIVAPNAIDILIKRFSINPNQTGIVEGRQWPAEHPKEFDLLTLKTPWASGAFCLVNANFYSSTGGMDEIYFLYNEDVDLSWMSWVSNMDVLYERNAVVTHFTDSSFFHDDNCIKNEKYYSTRNFIVLLRKFFGDNGENTALKYLNAYPDKEFITCILEDYYKNIRHNIKPITKGVTSPYIKIIGINQYHELRIE